MKNFNLDQFKGLDPYLEQELHEAEQLANQDDMSRMLEERFGTATGKRPWLIRKAPSRKSAFIFSFFCNLLSAGAGWYGALIVMEIIPIPYMNYLGALAGLILMEKYKRKFSDQFWDTYWATKNIRWDLGGKNFVLLLVSIALSIGGMFFAVSDFSPEAKYLGMNDDPETVAIQDRIRTLDEDIKALRADKANYNSNGEFYHIHARKENLWAEEKTALTQELKEVHGVQIIQNEDIRRDWKLRTGYRTYFGIIITLLAEIAFEICMAFCSYYDFRLFRALQAQKEGRSLASALNGKKAFAPTAT
ncbi:MAG: hypothetical protein R2828_35635 [Saprospiraceae bacterium]